jgi:Carboxypeptidase regulatory-like domain
MSLFARSYSASTKLRVGLLILLSGIRANAQAVPSIQTQHAETDAQVDGYSPAGDRLLEHMLLSQNNPDSTRLNEQLLSGNISGTVLDQTGAVTVGASVRLLHKDGSVSQEVISGDNGQFSFSRVPPGPFRLTITAPGFAKREFSGELRSGQTYLVPAIVMQVAAAETEVRVGLPTVEVAEAQIKEQEKQRVLAFIPNFYVSYVPDAAPLNARQKFKLAWKTSVDPITFVGAGIYAGFEQAGNRYPEYGQGAEGYAKRYGAGYADAVAGIFIGNAILPSLLKQDPRYFYKGTGTTRSRLLYAISSSVMCKGDNKRWQPNYSFIGGSIAVGGISNLYVPASDRNGVGLIFQNALIRIGQGSLGGILQEFVIRRLTPRVHHNSAEP